MNPQTVVLNGAQLALRAAVVLLFAAGLFFLKRTLFAKVHKMVERSDYRLDDLVIGSLGLPVNLLILAATAYAVTSVLPVDAGWREAAALALRATLAFGIFFFVDRLLTGLITNYQGRVELLAHSGGILKGVLHAVLLVFFLMTLFDLVGISLTPLVASLGVGSLAVALAFQDTLSNFFAGVYTMIDKSVRVGDYVRLESGEEGMVMEIGWRSTRVVRQQANNMVIIPNNKLTGSI
ncbi:MAG: mechanosensitive ion channel domain-containing protein, partial [Pseudomonadota bacterium]